jgi:Protein of unknown function (DUF3572)
MTQDAAEMLAIRALQYLAGDERQLARFLALTGTSIGDLRDATTSPAFLSGILDHLMGDEASVLSFAATAGCDPREVAVARDILSHHADC